MYETEQLITRFWELNNKIYYENTYALLSQSVDILNKIITKLKENNMQFEPKISFIDFSNIKIDNFKFNKNEDYNYITIHKNKIDTPFGVLFIDNIVKNIEK
jgi:hypothetical protein